MIERDVDTKHALGPVMALAAGAIWSLGAITAKLADHTDAFQYLIWRSAGIIVVVEVWCLVTRRPHRIIKAFTTGRRMQAATAMLLVASLCFVYALKTTPAANAAFLGATGPLFSAIGGRAFLNEKLTKRTFVAIGIAFCGLVIMVAGELQVGSMVGNIAAICSAIGFAGYTILVRSDPQRDWSPVMPGYALVLIGICVIVTLINDEPLVPHSTDIMLAVFHGAVFIVGGTVLYNAASHHVAAASMTVFAQSEMVLVPIWAFFILSETTSLSTIIGGSIIFAAVLGKALLDAKDHSPLPAPPALPG